MKTITRVLCFVCGLYAYLVTAQARYVGRDMSCPGSKLHSHPSSNEATMTIFLSVVDSYTRSTPPICRLEVRVPQITNMYQAMTLAEYQHNGRFNFSARSDELVGFTILHINGIWTRRRLSDWVLHDGETGKLISKSIAEVMMESRKSYIWVYTGYSAVENAQTYTGACITDRTTSIRGSTSSTDIAMVYLSVQFWSNTWPLCKIPVLFVDRSGVNLSDLMMEAMRQYRHLFVFQKYANYQIFDINELKSNGEYSWKAKVADYERELDDVLYLVPLEDGNHVIWQYVNEVGDVRRKTAKPEPRFDTAITPAMAEDTRNNNENAHGTADSRTGNAVNTANGRYCIPWTIIGISVVLVLSL